MHSLLLFEPVVSKTYTVHAGDRLLGDLAFDATAIGYTRRRHELANKTDPNAKLLQALAITGIETFTAKSVEAAKADVMKRENKNFEHTNFRKAWVSDHRKVTLVISCLVALILGVGVTVLMTPPSSQSFANALDYLVFGVGWLGLSVLFYHLTMMACTPRVLSWQCTTLSWYQTIAPVPDFILQRAVSIARLAPAAQFYVAYLGSDPFIEVHASARLDALKFTFGHWDEAELDQHQS